MKRTIFIGIAIAMIAVSCKNSTQYIKNEGYIFGTTYHFTYQSNQSYETAILEELKVFNASLSTYDPHSIISRINQNDSTVVADSYFIQCFDKAQEISNLSNGAFDITVAQLVNIWGFGFDESMPADSARIDSLIEFVGYSKLTREGNRIIKENRGTMLDASAIAKGLGVDVAAAVLEKLNIENYMIEIGGEVRAKGKNPTDSPWRIGIDKPIEDPTAEHRELQAIVQLENKSLATSGNYRQFYEKDGIKYSHTINPKTGYPARNSLLSASVLANDCMTADGFATAFMVLGIDESIKLANELNEIEVYFIYSDSATNLKIYSTPGFNKMIVE